MRILAISLLLFSTIATYAQDNPTLLAQPIVEEGMRLYRSEMTSWYGTDLFLAKYSNRENLGGYFSYKDEETYKCIFVSKAEQPLVIGTISFDSTFSTETAKVDLAERPLTSTEKDFLALRNKAIEIVNDDTLFKYYNNTSFNLIPLFDKNIRKVYILTGPQKPGVVIFGNDYLLTFDNNNSLLNKKSLHQNIIPVDIDNKESDSTLVMMGTSHIHHPETGDFITATDICTLMLYATTANWQQHIVVSEKYLNIWNCLENFLTVVPRNQESK